MAEDTKEKIQKLRVTVDPIWISQMDNNGDGHIPKEEYEMNMEFQEKRIRRCRRNA